jgi:2-phospho-L-lactate guanylyltransferase
VDRSWRVIIPLRLSDAKSRLSLHTAPRRRELVIAMALDVIVAAQQCPSAADVLLVADPPGIEEVTARVDVAAMPDPGRGLNAAIRAGAADAGGPVAALLADVPCATPDALALALGACVEEPGFVCDAEGLGTTLLASPSAARLDPHFGPRSRAAHAAAGIRDITDPTPASLAVLRRDVDSEVDLWDARRLGLGIFTREVPG